MSLSPAFDFCFHSAPALNHSFSVSELVGGEKEWTLSSLSSRSQPLLQAAAIEELSERAASALATGSASAGEGQARLLFPFEATPTTRKRGFA